MKAGVPRETYPDEHRVALVPGVIASLTKAGVEVLVETGAGERAGFTDAAFRDKGAQIVSRADVFAQSDVVLQVRGLGANRDSGHADLSAMRRDQALIAFLDPLGSPDAARELAATGVSAFSIELMPRITRAQSMDALSSQATIAGYKAVLIAAAELPRMFPMMMTAAGTLSPARVFVLGAGVAGLQAIATARRLGALVEAYDVRPAVKEQVESVGAKFVELPLETAGAEDKGGYAVAQDESFYRRQRETLTRVVTGTDVVITTAAIPGKKSPVLVTREMVEAMQPGSVIVDLAAERGGNCEVTRPDQMVELNGVKVLGPTNLPATVPYHASQMYAKNITTFLLHLVKEGKLHIDTEDEITRETLVTRDGEVAHQRVREMLGATAAA
ncbi:MAG TPA: Re/Si-specific NAD(P)(+) transhydrogenase subunit alpha [Gemmatimonadaceae bacterium]